jgi:hypothetical protein
MSRRKCGADFVLILSTIALLAAASDFLDCAHAHVSRKEQRTISLKVAV